MMWCQCIDCANVTRLVEQTKCLLATLVNVLKTSNYALYLLLCRQIACPILAAPLSMAVGLFEFLQSLFEPVMKYDENHNKLRKNKSVKSHKRTTNSLNYSL